VAETCGGGGRWEDAVRTFDEISKAPHWATEALNDMRTNALTWSWGTAIKAVAMKAAFGDNWDILGNPEDISKRDKNRLLREMQDAWVTDPICTSIVIIFWQRVLCKNVGDEDYTLAHRSRL